MTLSVLIEVQACHWQSKCGTFFGILPFMCVDSSQSGYSNGGGGIVQMVAKDIFNHVKNTPDCTFEIRASFIEIYNEDVRDLLGDNTVLPVWRRLSWILKVCCVSCSLEKRIM